MHSLGRGKGQRKDSLGYTRDRFLRMKRETLLCAGCTTKLDKEMRLDRAAFFIFANQKVTIFHFIYLAEVKGNYTPLNSVFD